MNGPNARYERCDGCPARAVSYVQVSVEGKWMPLTLCGHHLREYQQAMLARQLVSA